MPNNQPLLGLDSGVGQVLVVIERQGLKTPLNGSSIMKNEGLTERGLDAATCAQRISEVLTTLRNQIVFPMEPSWLFNHQPAPGQEENHDHESNEGHEVREGREGHEGPESNEDTGGWAVDGLHFN